MSEDFNETVTFENRDSYLIIWYDDDNLWRWDYFRLVKEYADGEVEWDLEFHRDSFQTFEAAKADALNEHAEFQ